MQKRLSRIAKYTLILAACAIGAVAGARRARAGGYLTIPGAGSMVSCNDTGEFCSKISYELKCVQYECSGTGNCGPNCGETCTTQGCKLVGCGGGGNC